MISLKDKIATVIGDFGYLLPEMIIVLGAILLLIVELLYKEKNGSLKSVLSFATLAAVLTATLGSEAAEVLFNGDLRLNAGTRLIKVILILTNALILLFPNQSTLKKRGEFHFLLLMVLLGAFIVLQSNNLLIFYLGVELISITSYLLISFGFDKKGFEAGIKYLLFGAVASGLMLYGLSLIYGLHGSLLIDDLTIIDDTIWWNLAYFLFLMGILFKLSLFPMHIWTPDAYEAGPTSVVAYISILPKIAVFMFLFQLVQHVEGEFNTLTLLLASVAIVSMFLGNLSAIAQGNAKRMMAYSSIAHSGFMLIGVVAGTLFGWQAMAFYLIVYAIMNIGAFYFVALMEKQGLHSIREYSGVGRNAPVITVWLVILMISLVGLPPTGGFIAKLILFSSLWEVYSLSADNFLFWLFILGIFNAAISLFYYLKIPYFMIFRQGEKEIKINWTEMLMMSVIGILLLTLFFKPNLLLNMLNETTFAF